jgi:hypothetical protein
MLSQNEKYLRRVNLGKDMLTAMLQMMSEMQEEMDAQFKELLNIDEDKA